MYMMYIYMIFIGSLANKIPGPVQEYGYGMAVVWIVGNRFNGDSYIVNVRKCGKLF